jgi:hypothetical protein
MKYLIGLFADDWFVEGGLRLTCTAVIVTT